MRKKVKVKWKHDYKIGSMKVYYKDLIRMLKIGARFELTPSYTQFLDKEGNVKKVRLNHVSLRLVNDLR